MKKKSLIAALAIGAGAIGTYRSFRYGWAGLGLIPPMPGVWRRRTAKMRGVLDKHVDEVRLGENAASTPAWLSGKNLDELVASTDWESIEKTFADRRR